MNRERRNILSEEWGKFSLGTAKLIIGGMILVGIMRTDITPVSLISYGVLLVAIFFIIGTFGTLLINIVNSCIQEQKRVADVISIVNLLEFSRPEVDWWRDSDTPSAYNRQISDR